MDDLLAPGSNSTWHPLLSNNYPIVYLCSDFRNNSSALILLFLIRSTPPKNVVLKSEFSSNLVVLNIFDCIPLYISKYCPFSFSGVSHNTKSNICFSSISMFQFSLLLSLFTVLIFKL